MRDCNIRKEMYYFYVYYVCKIKIYYNKNAVQLLVAVRLTNCGGEIVLCMTF